MATNAALKDDNPEKTLREIALDFMKAARGNPNKAADSMFAYFTRNIPLYRRFADAFMRRAIHDLCQDLMRRKRSIQRGHRKLASGEKKSRLRLVSRGDNFWNQYLGVCDKLLYDATYSDLQEEIAYYKSMVYGNAEPAYMFELIKKKLKPDDSNKVSDVWDVKDDDLGKDLAKQAQRKIKLLKGKI